MKNSNRLSQISDMIEAASTRLSRTNDEKEKEVIRKKLSYFYSLSTEKAAERKADGLKANQEFF